MNRVESWYLLQSLHLLYYILFLPSLLKFVGVGCACSRNNRKNNRGYLGMHWSSYFLLANLNKPENEPKRLYPVNHRMLVLSLAFSIKQPYSAPNIQGLPFIYFILFGTKEILMYQNPGFSPDRKRMGCAVGAGICSGIAGAVYSYYLIVLMAVQSAFVDTPLADVLWVLIIYTIIILILAIYPLFFLCSSKDRWDGMRCCSITSLVFFILLSIGGIFMLGPIDILALIVGIVGYVMLFMLYPSVASYGAQPIVVVSQGAPYGAPAPQYVPPPSYQLALTLIYFEININLYSSLMEVLRRFNKPLRTFLCICSYKGRNLQLKLTSVLPQLTQSSLLVQFYCHSHSITIIITLYASCKF
eukprot:TRINITY_DN89094_c1_g1_i1.p1 TRINITY_DN89094_c1_g1~~TRINITY_DN89094_c1_g1_i1.p1  ORF type:complete len:358 (+),score=-13.67 TRINITY_DN89094_c1_g1_i1:402-1475(+)